MQTLARLFGRSPFKPLQTHMEKVMRCVNELPPIFEALEEKKYEEVAIISKKICKLEHEADLTKNDIRNHLPSSLFLPMSRASLLQILAMQDTIADKAEDIGILLTLHTLELPSSVSELFRAFVQKNIETCDLVQEIIREMGSLLESSFGGSEAQKVKSMVEAVAYKEHEVDVLQRDLLKAFFAVGEQISSPAFFLWMKIVQELSGLSDEAEKLANRVRMTLEVK